MKRQRLRARSLLLSLFLTSFMVVGIPASHAALSIGSNTGNYYSNSGGGNLGSSSCPSNGLLSGIGGQSYNYDGATLTQLNGSCATIATNGQTIASTTDGAIGTYGSGAGSALTTATCGSSGGTQVIVGGRIYKTTNGYTAGVTLLCGSLPLGGSRAYGATLGTTTGTYQDIACATGSVAYGLYVYYGGILDKFGISCAPVINIPQALSITSLGTSSATFPYSQALSMATSGTYGTGSISFAISGGSATSCALSSSANNATITAASSGTCTITATIAADTNYASATSAAATFTFNQAGQAALAITSTTGSFGTALTLTTSGGTGTGLVTFSYASGTTTCSLAANQLTANGVGTCLITATKSADSNYSAISSSQTTITFSQGISTTSLSIPTGSITYRQVKALTTVTNAPGKVIFRANNAIIPGCKNLAVNAGNSFTAVCNYRSSIHGAIRISVAFTPTNPGWSASSVITPVLFTAARSGTR